MRVAKIVRTRRFHQDSAGTPSSLISCCLQQARLMLEKTRLSALFTTDRYSVIRNAMQRVKKCRVIEKQKTVFYWRRSLVVCYLDTPCKHRLAASKTSLKALKFKLPVWTGKDKALISWASVRLMPFQHWPSMDPTNLSCSMSVFPPFNIIWYMYSKYRNKRLGKGKWKKIFDWKRTWSRDLILRA